MRWARPSKIFCIGNGKTGTTSLAAALEMLGFRLGDQSRAELLIDHWAYRNFAPIVEYCESSQAFQDVPFCLDHTFVALDQAFPGARFILTVRDDARQWYESMVRFHTQLVGKGRLPTPDDMKAFTYRQPGWLWRAHQLIYGIDESNVFDRDVYIASYEAHIRAVRDYFRHRPSDLLVLNVAEDGAMDQLCRFLGVRRKGRKMPHLNSSCTAA